MAFFDKVIKTATLGIIDPKKNRDREREAQRAINAQVKAYRDQTELARQELERTRGEQDIEKRRVQEKQIRSLRRNYRAQGIGMLGLGQPAANDMASRLGE